MSLLISFICHSWWLAPSFDPAATTMSRHASALSRQYAQPSIDAATNRTAVSRYASSDVQLRGVGPDGVLQHADADFLVRDDVEVVGCVQLAGVRVLGLEHLGVLVVRHRLGGVDVPGEQADHVELLLDELDVGGRVEAGLGRARRRSRTRCRSPSCRSSCRRSRPASVMPASLNDTCSVPERWKIWAMFDDVGARPPRLAAPSAPTRWRSRPAPSASSCCGTMSTPPSRISTIEALVLVEALVDAAK